MPTQIHLLLAYVSGPATALLAAEAGWRAIRNTPPGVSTLTHRAARRTRAAAAALTALIALGAVALLFMTG